MDMPIKNRIGLLISRLLTAVIVLFALLLIAACLTIYANGSAVSMYTPEVIRGYWSGLSPLLWLTVALGISAAVLSPRSSVEKLPMPEENRLFLLLRCHEKTPAMRREERKRAAMLAACLILCAISVVVLGLYFLPFAKAPTTDTESMMTALMPVIILCFSAYTASFVLYEFCRRASLLREIDLAKASKPAKPTQLPIRPSRLPIQAAIAQLALLFVILGILNGGARDVWKKAIKICSECIGLG